MVEIGFVKVYLPSTYMKAQLDHALGTETSKPGGGTLRGHIILEMLSSTSQCTVRFCRNHTLCGGPEANPFAGKFKD